MRTFVKVAFASCGKNVPLLCGMARLKGVDPSPPFAVIWCMVELENVRVRLGSTMKGKAYPPPALSPMMVTLEASPPKRWMFFCTHSDAKCWSRSSTFGVKSLEPARNPCF